MIRSDFYFPRLNTAPPLLILAFNSFSNQAEREYYPFCFPTLPPRYGTSTSVIYNELEGLTSLLKYSAVPIGCCGIVLHPEWQRCAYPITFFTTAPLEVLQAAIEATDAEHVCTVPVVPPKANAHSFVAVADEDEDVGKAPGQDFSALSLGDTLSASQTVGGNVAEPVAEPTTSG